MRLATALRLSGIPRLALVGAGGKTTALFHLAHELVDPSQKAGSFNTVVLTTTTHFAIDQIAHADRHLIVETPSQIRALYTDLPSGILILTGLHDGKGRVQGLSTEILDQVLEMGEILHIPILIEADGSRQRPIKAPETHEPAIPPWVDTVIVLAGLSALGMSLNAEWVHRPERFAQITKMTMNETITTSSLISLLTSPEGGLKNIPSYAQRIVLLNQADNMQVQAQANHLSSALLPFFNAVIIASLAPQFKNDTAVPTPGLISQDAAVHAVHESVAGIILAAGEAKRMKQPKQILPFLGEPMLRHAVRAAISSGLSPVIVVTGAYHPEVQSVVQDLPVSIKYNPDWRAGQSTSIAAGLNALPPSTGSAVFLLADQPLVSETMILKLVELHAQSLPPIVAPLINGKRGNPVLFDRETFEELRALSGDVGGRALFSKYPIKWLSWNDPIISQDIDTPQDYQRLLKVQGREDHE